VGQTRSQVDAALQALYDQIPAIPDCTGACWISCGAVGRTDREDQRLRQAGFRLTPVDQARKHADTFWCEALTQDRRCGAYAIRPIECRLWGAVEDMPCPYGCVPEGGWLTAAEGKRLRFEALRISGHDVPLPAEALGVLSAGLDRSQEQGRAGIQLRARYNLPAGFRRQLNEGPCPQCQFQLTFPPGVTKGICGNCGEIVRPGVASR
jgi:Fe-S-cluster containining protein